MSEITPNQVDNATQGASAASERTFTQAEMDAIISDRLKRERAKYADYNELQAKAAKFDEAEAILNSVWVDLTLAETDEEWNQLRDDTIRRLIELGEPEVFKAYRQQWNAAAAIIVPLVREAQLANGIELYAPEQYERFP